jgi:hypothetical protein
MSRRHQQSGKRPRVGGMASVFCDEAGFTGNNLLDSEQEVFALAGAAIQPDRAKEVVERTIRDFKLQGTELKGSRMLKTDAGRRAVTSVLKACAEDVRLVTDLKKFALACRFFEYIFEPPLAEQNSIFYGCGFHLFIGNLLWMMLRARDASAETIFGEFSKFARDGNPEALEKLFPSGGLIVNVESDPLAAVSLFTMINRCTIQDEIDSIHGDHHRTFHGAGEVSDRACPFTLRQHDLVWVVDEVLVGKHLEKRNCLLLVRVNAVRWRLIRPAHNAVLGVITAERRKILRVPRIIQPLHILQVLASIHNVTSNFLDCLLEGTSGKEHKQEICLRECQPHYTPGVSA